ncbi:RNA 2',3'-cyclic phosphodiesterase [Corallincola spongiicola]|uniref:RNA 2',3'-cyclic phosphodiesterase n=2 Tax=Corallincola spongiicola TaxID=2520508 RepID=A0ABY1WR90_9GAMM|nr:RNA 2',3'-cyclic phosphodiesterase [Corallincola spongiicola]
MMTNQGKRLFLALGFNRKTQRQISQYQNQFATWGSLVSTTNLHQTLAFLGQLGEEQEQQLRLWCRQISAAGFKQTCDHFGYWRKPQIIYLAPGVPPPQLLSLVTSLHQITDALGIEREQRPYQPHITLCRKVRQPPELADLAVDISFHADHFALFQSRSDATGVRYIELERWPLLSN